MPEYRGPALLTIDDQRFDVEVVLAGRVEPVDGRFHWGGRIAPQPQVATLVRDGRSTAELSLGGPGRPVQLKDLDPWGSVRFHAVGHPPRALIEEDSHVT